MSAACQTHPGHSHEHKAGCGHTAVNHDGHTDYLHDGHLHHKHGDHVDDHQVAITATNRQVHPQSRVRQARQEPQARTELWA